MLNELLQFKMLFGDLCIYCNLRQCTITLQEKDPEGKKRKLDMTDFYDPYDIDSDYDKPYEV